MGDRLPGLLDMLRSRRSLRRWRRAAASGARLPAGDLARLGTQARQVAGLATDLAQVADRRLQGRRIGADGIDRPPQCDWAWRAPPWAERMASRTHAGASGGTTLSDGVRLFHDCPLAEITLRQSDTTEPDAHAPFALSMDTLGFDGSFLSLAIDLPTEAATSLTRGHIVRLSVDVTMERPSEMFARLNIRQGPNTEQLVGELQPDPGGAGPITAEFDLGFHDINPAKLEAVWIDLIFATPEMNLVRIADLTVTRRPRAEI